MKRKAFTLTEILIALALIAFLLVGISRVFTMMSNTIGAGQSVSTQLRGQKAIQQTLSNDFLGYGASIDRPDDGSGMMPLDPAGGFGGAPFLTISSYRVPAFMSQEDKAASFANPPDAMTDYAARSAEIRKTDNDGNGVAEIIPIYQLGVRNFRADTFSFFSRGDFQSQTGSAANTMQSRVRSRESYVMYGHARIFNSNIASIDTSPGHGEPGIFRTSGNEANPNNIYASQFQLGRYQILLVPGIDHDADSLTPPVVLDDNGDAVPYLYRSWASGNSLSPFNFGGIEGKAAFLGGLKTDAMASRPVEIVRTDTGDAARPGRVENFPAWPAGRPAGAVADTRTYMARTDVAAVTADEMRARVRLVQDVSPTWWQQLPATWGDRYFLNPYVSEETRPRDVDGDPSTPDVVTRSLSTRSLAQRQQIINEHTSQFIVEFAGDYFPADGVIDFNTIGGIQQTRWYGLPRDVDGDGTIAVNGADVMPVASYGARRPFERFVPNIDSSISGYPNGTTEPGTNPNASGYVCIWGPVEMEAGLSPRMIRVVTEIAGEKGRAAIQSENVFPVRLK